MKFDNGIELDNISVEEVIKNKYGFQTVTCIENTVFCARKVEPGSYIQYGVYEVVHVDSSKEHPTNYDMIIKALNRDNRYDGVEHNDDGYVVIENHLLMFSQDAKGKIQ